MTTAITTRTAKGSALTWIEEDANFNNVKNALDNNLDARLSIVESGQLTGTIGFATKADMDADLAHDAGKIAIVTNDTTASNNTFWRKTGASGSGSWILSVISPFLPFISSRQFTTLAQAITAIGSSSYVLVVTTELIVTTGDIIPATMGTVVYKGGAFVGTGSETLHFAGDLKAGKYRIFTSLGTITGLKTVYSEWWAENTIPGTTNMASAIQAAYDCLGNYQGGNLILWDKYNIATTTLIFDKEFVKIKGIGNPNLNSGGTTLGGGATEIIYTGTGTAIRMGVIAAGVAGGYTKAISLENFVLSLGETTSIGIAAYGLAFGYIKNVVIFGNSGSSNCGIKIFGGMMYELDSIEISGLGTQTIGDYANYLGSGITIVSRGSIPNWQTTTISIKNTYLMYCQKGFLNSVDQIGISFNNVVFENCIIGLDNYGQCCLIGSWFEHNSQCTIYFRNTSLTDISGCRIDSGSSLGVFNGADNFVANIEGSDVVTDLAFGYLFPAGTSITGKVNLKAVSFTKSIVPSNMRVCGTIGTDIIGSDIVKINDMDVVIYRFVYTPVTANLSQYPVPRDIVGFSDFKAKENGNIIGLNAQYSLGITTGNYTVDVLKNGSGGYMRQAGITSNLLIHNHDFLSAKFNKTDIINTQFITSSNFAPTGGAMIIEVVVAYGRDGKD